VEKDERQEMNKLRARVRELELVVATQTKLIEIFKSMPNQAAEVKRKDDAKTQGVSKRNQARGGSVAKNGAKREPENSGKHSLRDNTNGEVVEKQ
jgi:uncharacterized coiled-coil protein SlyX